MEESQAKTIRDQLTSFAEKINSQPNGETNLYFCMYYLSDAVGRHQIDITALSEDEFRVFFTGYKKMAVQITQFLQQAQHRPMTDKQKEVFDQLNAEIGELTTQIEDERQELTQLKQKRAEEDANLAIQRAQNKLENDNLIKARENLINEQEIETQLKQDLQQVTPEIIEKQRQENDQLAIQVATQSANLNRLKGAYRSAYAKLKSIDENCTKWNQKIEQMPEKQRKREEAFSKLEKRLWRIQNIEEECSEEKKQALETEIAERGPKANQLKTEFDAVKEQHSQIEAAYQNQLANNKEAEKQLLDVLNAAIDALEIHSGSLAQRLRDAMARCKQFEDNLQLCRNEYTRYHVWMESQVPALEAMSAKAGLSEQEYEALYATMDPGKCKTIQDLQGKAEEALRQLDEILTQGMNAAELDEKVTRKRAEDSEAAGSQARMKGYET